MLILSEGRAARHLVTNTFGRPLIDDIVLEGEVSTLLNEDQVLLGDVGVTSSQVTIWHQTPVAGYDELLSIYWCLKKVLITSAAALGKSTADSFYWSVSIAVSSVGGGKIGMLLRQESFWSNTARIGDMNSFLPQLQLDIYLIKDFTNLHSSVELR